jgi:hypothetical protein
VSFRRLLLHSPGFFWNVKRFLCSNGLINTIFRCNVTDWAKIVPIFASVKSIRRSWRTVDITGDKWWILRWTLLVAAFMMKRKLLTNVDCRIVCAVPAEGTNCHAAGCTGHNVRRKLGEDWCTAVTFSPMNAHLNNLWFPRRASIETMSIVAERSV